MLEHGNQKIKAYPAWKQCKCITRTGQLSYLVCVKTVKWCSQHTHTHTHTLTHTHKIYTLVFKETHTPRSLFLFNVSTTEFYMHMFHKSKQKLKLTAHHCQALASIHPGTGLLCSGTAVVSLLHEHHTTAETLTLLLSFPSKKTTNL